MDETNKLKLVLLLWGDDRYEGNHVSQRGEVESKDLLQSITDQYHHCCVFLKIVELVSFEIQCKDIIILHPLLPLVSCFCVNY